MPMSQKEIHKEVGRRTIEQLMNIGYFLGGLAVFSTGELVTQTTDTTGDLTLAVPTMAVGALMAIRAGEKMLHAGLRSDFNKKSSER